MEPQNIPINPQPQKPLPDGQEQQIKMLRQNIGSASALASPNQTVQASPTEPTLKIPAKPVFDADEPVFTPNTVAPQPSARVFQTAPAPATTAIIPPAPPVAAQTAAPSVDALIAQRKSKGKMKTIIFGVAGLVVIAAAAYFIVPLFKTAPVEPAPIAQQPAGSVTPVEPTQPAKTTPAIVSLFTVEPAARGFVAVNKPYTAAVINEALTKTKDLQGTRETMLMNFDTPQRALTFVEIIGALAPSIQEKTAQLFSGEVSSYTFSDAAGNWPGYVAKLKMEANATDIKDWFSSLEKTSEKKNFFVTDPGTLQTFKNGLINNTYPDRYAPGTTAGASFSYLILPEKKLVLIGTSFEGMKDALRLLQ